MLLQGIKEHNIDPEQSIMVGDKLSDMQAAQKAGIATRVLVRSGQSFDESAKQNADLVIDSIDDLTKRLPL